MNEIEQEVAERVRAAVIQHLTLIWQGHWRRANDYRMNGRKADEYASAKQAITINLARESIRMMDVEELLAPVNEEETV
jgi:hypothetical protein